MSEFLQSIYRNERLVLSPYACLSEKTAGRAEPITPCPYRTDFQRDRDRIIHSKAFRRLMHKTQVFLSPEEDHYRTRLTHTLEVSQVARSIARALRLNEDLTEAIALGHDLGHTPFGHAGERVLADCMPGGFTHYQQSLRVVDRLERLNLTAEVRDGIVCHTKGGAKTLEGRIIKEADHIAYINHDIDDATRGGIIEEDDIPLSIRNVLGYTASERIETMVTSIIRASEGKDDILWEDDILAATEELHDLLYQKVYRSPIAKGQESKAEEMVRTLYYHFVAHPETLPDENRVLLASETVERVVCDYISGMTDRFAVKRFRELFIPNFWQG